MKNQNQLNNLPLPSEHAEQSAFINWFRWKYPTVRIFAIPNGGWRNPATAKLLKAEGVVKGVPDLCIPAWGLWLEMKKRKGGTVSPEQKDWIEYLNGCKYRAVVCNGMDEAMKVIEEEASRWQGCQTTGTKQNL